jgi:hypothetical protein
MKRAIRYAKSGRTYLKSVLKIENVLLSTPWVMEGMKSSCMYLGTKHGFPETLGRGVGGYPSLLTMCPGMFKSTHSPMTAVLCYRLPVYTNLKCNTRTHFNTRGHRCPYECTSVLSPIVQDVKQWQISFNSTSC